MLPGANIFISQEDVSRPASFAGGTAIHCKAMSDVHGASTASKGWNYLRRILAGISEV